MAIKNSEVLHQIEEMLQDLKKQDKQQHKVILTLLNEVFTEYNTGKTKNVEKKLYELIDTEVRFKLKQ